MIDRFREFSAVFAVAVFLAGAAWLAGFATALIVAPPGPAVPENVSAPDNFELYRETWRIVEREYYGELPAPRIVTYAAIEGMVQALEDPYSAFLDRETAGQTVDNFLPEVVGGIGAWVEPVTNGALVVSTVPDTPAERAGLLPGDVVLAVSEEALAGLDREAILDELRGPAGTSAVLVVSRSGTPPFTLEVVRDEFDLPSVEVRRLDDGVGYLRLAHFQPAVVEDVDQALEDLTADDALRSLILDLRANPGGDLDTVRAVAGRLMEGEVWIEVGPDGEETARRATDEGAPDLELPEDLVVLTNSGTASAAEMLAGALRDQRGATLVGGTTFGKGKIQVVAALTDRSLLRLTVAHWQTPSGTEVEGVGLTPDREVDGAEAQLEAALEVLAAERQAARDGSGG